MPAVHSSLHSEITRQYFEEKVSALKLSKKYNTSHVTITTILKKDGRPLRSAAGHHTREDADIRLIKIADKREAGETIEEIAKYFNISMATVSEHLENLGFSKIPRHWNPDRKAIAKRVLALYHIGMFQKDIEKRLHLGRGYARKLLNYSDEKDLIIRGKGWTQKQKAKVKAEERRGLYEDGMTCKEIDDFLQSYAGHTYRLLKKYYPEILISAHEQQQKSNRKSMAAANKELTNAGQVLSRRTISLAKQK